MKKKWFLGILIVAIIAVILTIVFINLFGEKDTKELSQEVHSYIENGYLSQENEDYEKIIEYLDAVYPKLSTSTERSEVLNYKNAYQAYAVAGEFFDRQMVFTEFTDVYKNNRKKIENNLNNAQEKAQNLAKTIKENENLTNGSEYWEANTWANYKGEMREIISSTTTAINLLGEVYISSVPSKIMNNDLTKLIFDVVKEYSIEILEKTTQDEMLGQKLNEFVNYYLTKEGEVKILNFLYNSTSQDKVADIVEKGKESEFYSDLLEGRIAG